MDTLRTLEILITSRTPLIAIETLEEERAEQVLERVAGRLRIPLFVWTMTRGLRWAGAIDSLYETKEPLKALRNVAEMNEGIYLMKDLYRSLNDPAVVRTLQDLAHAFSHDRRALVMTAPRVDLPPELATLSSLVRLELPTQGELRTLALPPELMRKGRFDEIFFIDLPTADERRQIFSVHLARRQRDPAGFDLPALAAASNGFSGAEIEQAVVSGLYTAFARNALLSTDPILEELKATKPLSVIRAEDVDELREWARGRTVPAA
jgi:hypothetical protein